MNVAGDRVASSDPLAHLELARQVRGGGGAIPHLLILGPYTLPPRFELSPFLQIDHSVEKFADVAAFCPSTAVAGAAP